MASTAFIAGSGAEIGAAWLVYRKREGQENRADIKTVKFGSGTIGLGLSVSPVCTLKGRQPGGGGYGSVYQPAADAPHDVRYGGIRRGNHSAMSGISTKMLMQIN